MHQLLSKYDIAGPRYTSYPPAPLFTSSVGPERYRDALEREFQREEPRRIKDISLYFHLPFCDTLCYFCGCNMLVSNNRERIHEYVEYLKKEIDLVSRHLSRDDVRVTQMHWGGGSPTHLLPEEIEELGLYIREHFPFRMDAEVSIEVDPRGFTKAHAAAMQRVGFNRASVGVQDFSPDTQYAINRVQPFNETKSAIELMRAYGVSSINIDLIYGLPYQSMGTFKSTLDSVLQLSPERIAIYNFAYVPWVKPHQKLIQIDTLPEPVKKYGIVQLATQKLALAGYAYIGMDHFARPTDELALAREAQTLQRNFQGYSTRAGAILLGLGMSAISRLPNMHVQNTKNLSQYYAALDANHLPTEKGYVMTDDDKIRENAIMQIMCNLSLDWNTFQTRYGIEPYSYFASSMDKLKPLADDGLVSLNGKLEVTERGKYFLRNIAMCFDSYFDPQESSAKPLYSRTM